MHRCSLAVDILLRVDGSLCGRSASSQFAVLSAVWLLYRVLPRSGSGLRFAPWLLRCLLLIRSFLQTFRSTRSPLGRSGIPPLPPVLCRTGTIWDSRKEEGGQNDSLHFILSLFNKEYNSLHLCT